MGFNATTIKLGRLFMVAWLAFFIYPLVAFLTDRLNSETRTYGLLLLLALAALWAWFWTRIIGGPWIASGCPIPARPTPCAPPARPPAR